MEDQPLIATLTRGSDGALRNNDGPAVKMHMCGLITTSIDNWGSHNVPQSTKSGDALVVEGGTYSAATEMAWCLRKPPDKVYLDTVKDLEPALKKWAASLRERSFQQGQRTR